MKKKLFNILLVIILLVGLTGCGSNSSNDNSENKNNQPEEKVNNETMEIESVSEDNQELIDLLNNTVNALLDYSKTNEFHSFKPSGIYQVEDKLKEDGINNYEFLAICDQKFTEKVELKSFAYTEDMIPNYEGKCTYSTWSFDDPKYNNGDNRYTLLKDKNTDDYYSIKITFKKTTHYDKDKYYPVFSNSELLK